MEAIKQFFDNIDSFVGQYLDKFLGLLDKNLNIIYAGVALIAAVLMLVGLIASIKKIPGLFFLIVILVAVFCTLSYFFYYKN